MTKSYISTLGLIAVFLFPVLLRAEAAPVATLRSIEGTVQARRVGASAFAPATAGMEFAAGDVITTARSSRAGIAFANGGFLRLGENTSLQFQAQQAAEKKSVSVDKGRLYYFSRDPRNSPVVDTPSATMAIRGTEFALEVSGSRSQLAVLDGQVHCSNQAGAVNVANGEQAMVEQGRAPVKTILLRPLDAVQWAIYYPELPLPERAPQALRTAAFLMSRGDVAGAEQNLKQAELAAARLTGSEQSEIRAAILAHQAIVSLSKNEKEQAEAVSEQAYTMAPAGAAALLSRSYVAQAFFRLPEARRWTEQLIASAPSLAVGYARLAELELGFGELDAAIMQARKAVELEPGNAYVLTVLGFSALVRSETDQALESFEAAAAKDPSFALARLGTGLARIQRGDLSGGRRDLEEASFLSPNVAVYRSYLGKAYFEEEDETRAGHEFERAVSLDPLDPTPYLYRAFNRLSANDPVQALRDVEESIERNNNRAVYRSSLLLDQDLAVRSAGLSKVFTDLGFARAAEVEAVKSISRDYANYSAHLLLADSYQSIFAADAGFSERRIAELLAPLSFNLFQQPAGQATLNEYDALFDRPERRTELSLTASSYDDLLAPALQYADKQTHWAYGLAFEPLMTGGSKHNNYSRRYRSSARASYQPGYSDRFTIGVDASYHKFRERNNVPEQMRLESGRLDLAYLHSFAAASKLILFASYGNDRNRFALNDAARTAYISEIFEGEVSQFEDQLLIDGLTRERIQLAKAGAQHVFDSDLVSTVTGLEYHNSQVQRREQSQVLQDEAGLFDELDYAIRTSGYNDVNAGDVYSYTTWHLIPGADLTLGGTYSWVEIERQEVPPFTEGTKLFNRFNPKIGLVTNPLGGVTVRAAYFEGLRKSVLEDAVSVEPTLVGGINQRFTDYSGTRSRNLGLGLDCKLPGSTYVGLEGIRRNVRENGLTGSHFIFDYDEGTLSSDIAENGLPYNFQKQDFVRGYLSQILTPRLAANVSYEWAKFEDTIDELPLDVGLHKVVINSRYFHPSGFYPFVSAVWREQDRRESFLPDGTSAFWTADAGIGYRLPRRHGSIALQVSNIFDEDFIYDQSLGVEPAVFRGIGVTLSGSVNF